MNIMVTLINSPVTERCGWTLVNFLWQGMIVGGFYAVLRQRLSRKSPVIRYRLAMGTLAIMALLPIITFVHLSNAAGQSLAPATLRTLAGARLNRSAPGVITPRSAFEYLNTWLRWGVPWAVPLWLMGVLIMALRVWRGWRHAHHLRANAQFIALPEWQAVLQSLCVRLGVRRLVGLAVSIRINVPSVIGWLKPIILIPPSAMAGLTPLQMELVLTHELAHIRRQDYLWNLLQTLVETLLFYHPVIRWVSRHARIEREQCCDDIVVGVHGNAIDYARALTELEDLRHPQPLLLLGASGGSVMDRIHRLLGVSAPDTAIFGLPALLTLVLLFAFCSVPWVAPRITLPSIRLTHYSLLGEAARAPEPSVAPRIGTLQATRVAAGIPRTDAVRPVATLHERPVRFLSVPALPRPARNFRSSPNPSQCPARRSACQRQSRSVVRPSDALLRPTRSRPSSGAPKVRQRWPSS